MGNARKCGFFSPFPRPGRSAEVGISEPVKRRCFIGLDKGGRTGVGAGEGDKSCVNWICCPGSCRERMGTCVVWNEGFERLSGCGECRVGRFLNGRNEGDLSLQIKPGAAGG